MPKRKKKSDNVKKLKKWAKSKQAKKVARGLYDFSTNYVNDMNKLLGG